MCAAMSCVSRFSYRGGCLRQRALGRALPPPEPAGTPRVQNRAEPSPFTPNNTYGSGAGLPCLDASFWLNHAIRGESQGRTGGPEFESRRPDLGESGGVVLVAAMRWADAMQGRR